MTKYTIYVNGMKYCTEIGWYNTHLTMKKLERKYKGMRITKQKTED